MHALEGCRYVVHCAALYTFAPRAKREIAAVNVEGTASLMLAAELAGVERVVLRRAPRPSVTRTAATIAPNSTKNVPRLRRAFP